MHFFAVFLFLSLGVMTLTMLGERATWRFREGRAFLAGAFGVGVAWLANINMWIGWGVANLRHPWIGVTLTGVALGGAALLEYGLFGFFAGMHRKLDDEAEVIERQEIRKIEPISRAS